MKTVQTPSSPGTSHKLMTLHHDLSHTSTLDDDNNNNNNNDDDDNDDNNNNNNTNNIADRCNL